MTQRITQATPTPNNQNSSITMPERTATSRAVQELAQHFKTQQTFTPANKPKSREALQSRYLQFTSNVNLSIKQTADLRQKLESAPHNIELISEIEEIKLIIQSLLAELPSMPRGKIVSANGADIYDELTSNLHYFLSQEIDLKTIKIHLEIAENGFDPENRNVNIESLMDRVATEQKLDALKEPTKQMIENILETYHLNPEIQTLKLDSVVSNSFNRIHNIQRNLKNYAYFDSVAEQSNSFFVSQRHIIADILSKVSECYQQTMTVQCNSFVKMRILDGQVIEHDEHPESKSETTVFANLLPKIEQLGELGISTLAHLIETTSVNQHPLHTEQRLLQQLNDLCYFTEKFSWAVRELCMKEGKQHLLTPAERTLPPTDDSTQLSMTAALSELELDSEPDLDQQTQSVQTDAKIADIKERRLSSLLNRCDAILAQNPMTTLASVKRNPGFYSPATVQQIYTLFNAQAGKVCTMTEAAKNKIDREIQYGNFDRLARQKLKNYADKLNQHKAILDEEMQFSSTDDFTFNTLKQHKTPRAQSWTHLIESQQVATVSLIGKLPSDRVDEHLYEFELSPTSDSSGNKFPSVWLHVHLNKNVHKPTQWQSLEPADVKAAHLKPDHARNLGAKWQEEQRARGNYNTVVERSRVNIDFIKLVASKVEATAQSTKNLKKGKGKRR